MPKNSFMNRFVMPVVPVLLLAIIGYAGYFGSRGIEHYTLHQVVAAVSGALYFAAIAFGTLYVFTSIVIYMGDNGMQWGTHDCHGIREPYEDSIRLPFIVRAPGMVKDPGGKRKQMVLNIDIAPTLLGLAGVRAPADMDGMSIVPAVRNPRAKTRNDFLLEFWRYYPENTPSYRGVRTDRYKYVEFERGRDPWLFDLNKDPDEIVNLYETKKGRKLVVDLKKNMDAYAP